MGVFIWFAKVFDFEKNYYIYHGGKIFRACRCGPDLQCPCKFGDVGGYICIIKLRIVVFEVKIFWIVAWIYFAVVVCFCEILNIIFSCCQTLGFFWLS